MAQDFSLCWDIDSLNKAYRQGYMAGVMGADKQLDFHPEEIVQTAWEAGWEDGLENCALEKPSENFSNIA
jgi:ribosome modulation factor